MWAGSHGKSIPFVSALIYNNHMTTNIEPFTDTVGEHILGAIQVDIEQSLIEDWNQSNLDEGAEFAEYKFMQFAPLNLKQSYNEYYGYTEKDEFYLC